MRVCRVRTAYLYLRALITFLVCFAATPSFADLLAGTAFESGVRRLDETTGEELPGGVAPGSAGLFLTSGVTVGPDGNIYVSSRGTGEVLFFDGDTGFPLPSPHVGGRPGLFATLTPNPDFQSPAPGPLRFGPDGDLYVSDFGGMDVRKFDGATGVELAPAATAMVGPPAGLAFDANGDLYFGDFGSASVIKVSGGVPSIFIQPQAGGLQTASSLLFQPDGKLLVADLFGNQILRFDADGQNPTQFAVIPPEIPNPLPMGADFPTNYPSDLAFDSNGDLVVAVLGLTNPPDNRGAILRYELSGGAPEILLDMQPQFASIARIEASTFLLGDYDRNGLIQQADHDKWLADFGTTAAIGEGADGNGDGVVDAADYVVWRNAVAGGAAIAAALVPEPSTAILTSICVLFACGPCITRRCRRF